MRKVVIRTSLLLVQLRPAVLTCLCVCGEHLEAFHTRTFIRGGKNRLGRNAWPHASLIARGR